MSRMLGSSRPSKRRGYTITNLGTFKSTRKFSGDRYSLTSVAPTKRNAQSKAKILRNTLDRNVRVVKTKSGYGLYSRKK